ncbi:hypothetical protein ACS0PU_002296 [Formica fusca]
MHATTEFNCPSNWLSLDHARRRRQRTNSSNQIADTKPTEIIHKPDSRRKFNGGRGEGRMEFSGSYPYSRGVLFVSPVVASFAGGGAAGSQTLSGSNDASSGNGEGSSRPEVRHIRARTRTQ